MASKSKPTRIVLTGGPCAGKSTAMSRLTERLEGLGYKVLCIPETATQIILAGLNPSGMSPSETIRFQSSIVQMQKAWEEIMENHAHAQQQKTVILLDRGIWDCAAYTPHEQWEPILHKNGVSHIERDTRYDAVIHMVTAAIGAEEAYTKQNNKARRENLEEARVADQKTMDAWVGHPHLRIVPNSGFFEQKIHHVLKEITEFLGEPVPIEDERKFLVEVDFDVLKTNIKPRATSDIVQHYIQMIDNDTEEEKSFRVRRRGSNGQWVYTHNVKVPIPGNPSARYEIEYQMAGEDYWDLIAQHPNSRQVQKTRTCIVFNNIYFELDQIQRQDGNPLLLLEVETSNKGDIEPPQGIRIIREVTDDPSYYNQSLAETPDPNKS